MCLQLVGLLLSPRSQHGPDPNVVKLPSGPTDIDVSLPPGSAVDDTSREGRHSSASVQISTIVFVHGVCSASALYQPIIQLSGVRDKYRVVTYDLEGHGLSPLNDESGDMDIEKWARTLGEVLDFVGVQRAVIVGHSVGGASLTLQLSYGSDSWTVHSDQLCHCLPRTRLQAL